jgi:hypothetical protein
LTHESLFPKQDEESAEDMQNSFLVLPVFATNDYPKHLLEECKHLSQEGETTSVVVPQQAIQGPLPYAEVYTDDALLTAGLQRHNTKLVLAKGAPFPPHVVIENGGFHPKGVLPGQELRVNALDVIHHRGTESAGSGVVSSTNNIAEAKDFAFYKSEEDTGYVYIFIAPPGTISDLPEYRGKNPFPKEGEFTIPGGIDHTDILLWREVTRCEEGTSPRFKWPLHINIRLLRKYVSCVPRIYGFLLEKDECLFSPQMCDTRHESHAILQKFLHCATTSQNIDETLMAAFFDLTYYCSYSMLLNHLREMDDENKAILVKRSAILSAKYHTNDLLRVLLEMPEADQVKEQVLMEAIYSENVVAVELVIPQIDINSINLDYEKVSPEMALQLMHISEVLFRNLLAECDYDYSERIITLSVIKKQCCKLSEFLDIDMALIRAELFEKGRQIVAGQMKFWPSYEAEKDGLVGDYQLPQMVVA